MLKMYEVAVNSPQTTLAEDITVNATTIPLTDASVLGTAPNIFTIGEGEDAETVYFPTAASSDIFTGVTREFEGGKKAWSAGTPVYRAFCAYDANTMKSNIELAPVGMYRQAVVNGGFDVWQRLGTEIATTHRARNSNVATITTATNHNLVTGDIIAITKLGAWEYENPAAEVTVTGATTFTYANTGDNEGSTGDTAGRVICTSVPTFINPDVFDFTADRWMVAFDADGGTPPTTILHQKAAVASGGDVKSLNCMKITTSGAGSSFGADSYYGYEQFIMGGTSRLAGDGKKVTISFRARSSITGKKIGCYLVQNYGTGGDADETIAGDNLTLTSVFQLFSCTFETNTLSGKTVADDNALIPTILVQWGSTTKALVDAIAAETWGGSGYIEITDIQFSAGDVVLEYIPRSYIDELIDCRFDYERYGANGHGYQFVTPCVIVSTTQAYGYFLFPEKRWDPTIDITDATKFTVFKTGPTDTAITSMSTAVITKTSSYLDIGVAGGLTAGQAAFLRTGYQDSGYIEISTGV